MNNKGLFSFLLILIFVTIELNMLEEQTRTRQELLKTKNISIESEKATLTRAIIEHTLDQIIEEQLKRGMALELKPEEIKNRVNEQIEKAIQKTKNTNSQNQKITSKEKIDKQYLNKNSTVIVKRIGKNTLQAEYHYTGGLMKNNELTLNIRGKNTEQEFKLPIGYTIKAKLAE